MVDTREGQETDQRPSELYRQGRDKPPEVEGFVWVPVRGLDPTKPTGEPSGWRGVRIPDKQADEFVIPLEVQAEEQKRQQTDAGVGSHAARTEAGMRRAEERADERAETLGSKQEEAKVDE